VRSAARLLLAGAVVMGAVRTTGPGLSAARLAGGQAERTPPAFTAGVGLVEVWVSVEDVSGRPVDGLTSQDFEVREDGRVQPIALFDAAQPPVTVALGVDRSVSMAGRPLGLALRAAAAFLRSLRPDDRSLVLSVGSDAEVLAPVTAPRETQVTAVLGLDAWGTTALWDATLLGLDRLADEPGRQAFIVFSDGTDRYSRATPADVLARARRGRTLIYPIAIGRSRPAAFEALAAATGGQSFLVRDAGGIAAALATVREKLRHQYLLAYAPSPRAVPGAPVWRSIAVRLVHGRPGTRLRARNGYLASEARGAEYTTGTDAP